MLQVLNLTIQVAHTAPKRFQHFMEAVKNKTQGQPLPFQLLLFFHQHQVLPQQNAASRVSDNVYNQTLIYRYPSVIRNEAMLTIFCSVQLLLVFNLLTVQKYVSYQSYTLLS